MELPILGGEDCDILSEQFDCVKYSLIISMCVVYTYYFCCQSPVCYTVENNYLGQH